MTGPLDETDRRILDEVRDLMDHIDPVPPDLTDRVKVSITLAALDAELAELTAAPLVGVRADATETDSLTFTGSRLALMITVAERRAGTVTLDGWVSEPGTHVEIHHIDGVDAQTVDDAGRLVVTLPRGPVWFVLHPPGDGADVRPVVTPTVSL